MAREIDKVRRSLLQRYGRDGEGKARVDIVRNLVGGSYYYFIGELGFDRVPSLYWYSLAPGDVDHVIAHVMDAVGPA